MKTSVIIGVLACVFSMAVAIPSYASKTVNTEAAAVQTKTKIGVSLPASANRYEAQFIRQAFENRGYDVALYFSADDGADQVSGMLQDGCNVVVVGSASGHVLDAQMNIAEQQGLEIMSYGSALINSDALGLVGANLQAAYTRMGAISDVDECFAPELSRIELFSGVVRGSEVEASVYNAISEINPSLESDAVLVRSEFISRSIVDRVSADPSSLIALN